MNPLDLLRPQLDAQLVELSRLAARLASGDEDIRAALPRLREITQLLDYFTTPQNGIDLYPAPSVVARVKCAVAECASTWRTPDACLTNFAEPGQEPLWLCRWHRPPPKIGHLSLSPTLTEQSQRDVARTAAWNKLTHDERKLLNGNIV